MFSWWVHDILVNLIAVALAVLGVWLFRRAQLPTAVVASLSVVISSGLFSLFHHVGVYGEPFTISAFTFRFTAGAVLALLFYARGFAVAAWTHSLYDVFLILTGGA